MDINDLQATVTAGSCSSRVIFNVPKARSTGVELEFDVGAEPQLRLRHLGERQRLRAALDADLDRPERHGLASSPASRSGTSPADRAGVPDRGGGHLSVGGAGRGAGYVTGTYQHIGSRFTQVGDQDLGTLNLLSFGANTIGGPLTASTFTFNPELPAYDILNLRVGVRRNSGTRRSSSTT